MSRAALALLAIFVAVRIAAWSLFPSLAEDGYIVARWAEQAAAGQHAGFGPTSAPWALWLSLGRVCGFNVPLWARLSALIVEAGSMALLFRAPISDWHRGLLVAMFSSPYFLRLSTSGLESPVCVGAILLLASFPRPAAFLLALLRPDTALFGVMRDWRGALAGAIGHVACSLLLFRSPLSPTLHSKLLVYGVHPFAGTTWWDWLLPTTLGHAAALSTVSVLVVTTFAAAAWRRRDYALPAAAWILGMTAIGAPFFWWYLGPARAAVTMAGTATTHWSRLTLAALIATTLCGYPLELDWAAQLALSEVGLAKLGDRLATEQGSILLEPAGLIPYRARRLRVIDEVGLLTPAIAVRRARDPDWWAHTVRDSAPDWIVTRARNTPKGLLPTAFAGIHARIDLPLLERGYKAILAAPTGNVFVVLWRKR